MSAMLSLYNVEAFLLDGPTPGSGEAFDWTRASGLRQHHPRGWAWTPIMSPRRYAECDRGAWTRARGWSGRPA